MLLQRAERKDDLDVATLLEAGLSLADGLAAANALYGPAFPPEEALKALVTFADGDLPELPISIQRRLEAAVLADSRCSATLPALCPGPQWVLPKRLKPSGAGKLGDLRLWLTKAWFWGPSGGVVSGSCAPAEPVRHIKQRTAWR